LNPASSAAWSTEIRSRHSTCCPSMMIVGIAQLVSRGGAEFAERVSEEFFLCDLCASA
jgi:hypothetical protein